MKVIKQMKAIRQLVMNSKAANTPYALELVAAIDDKLESLEEEQSYLSEDSIATWDDLEEIA